AAGAVELAELEAAAVPACRVDLGADPLNRENCPRGELLVGPVGRADGVAAAAARAAVARVEEERLADALALRLRAPRPAARAAARSPPAAAARRRGRSGRRGPTRAGSRTGSCTTGSRRRAPATPAAPRRTCAGSSSGSPRPRAPCTSS